MNSKRKNAKHFVPFTSQECALCGHIHSDNRRTQSEFVCLECGHAANTDLNAAEVIKKRGVDAILKQDTRGTRESARGGNRKTLKASKSEVQALRSENGSSPFRGAGGLRAV